MNPRCSYTPEIDALRHEQRESVLANIQESFSSSAFLLFKCMFLYTVLRYFFSSQLYTILYFKILNKLVTGSLLQNLLFGGYC